MKSFIINTITYENDFTECCNPDKIVDEYLKTHPEPLSQPKEVSDKMIEKAAMKYEEKRRYLSSPSTAYACYMDGAKAMRDKLIK
jgi:hypothetical protein